MKLTPVADATKQVMTDAVNIVKLGATGAISIAETATVVVVNKVDTTVKNHSRRSRAKRRRETFKDMT